MNTIHEASAAFLFHCKFEKKLSPKTTKAYDSDCRQFAQFLSKLKHSGKLSEIDKHTIKAYLEHLHGMRPKTLRRKIATLKAMFNFLEYEEEILTTPFRKMKISIREPRMLPRVMTLHEVQQILSYAQKKVQANSADTTSAFYRETLRNQAILELLFATGMRVSEATQLLKTEIDLRSGIVRIMGKGSRQRVIQICHNEVLQVLANYQKTWHKTLSRRKNFFLSRRQTPLSEQSIRNMIRHYAQKCGIKKHITPHTFRHSFATLLLEQDVDIKYIQQFLGHSSINTTQIYTHVNAEKQKAILKTRHPRLAFEVS
ncbi:MAG: tyrosine-type recombinase/integrase [Bacteroidetes bacterium]|nr:tyrosine-type recombinase/integrase [Bacteroidota bacterium]